MKPGTGWLPLFILLPVVFSCSPRPLEKELVLIPRSTSIIGSKRIPQLPERTETVASFAIMRTEATNAQYEACVKAGACTARRAPLPPTFADPQQPAVMLTWEQARTYCAWRGWRLPTETEWERAARGPNNWLYPWGNDFMPGAANGSSSPACERGGKIYRFTAPVGFFPRDVSPYGVMDMAANVAEWTADFFDTDQAQRRGYNQREIRLIKGTHFYGEPEGHSGAWRDPSDAAAVSLQIGFRCAAKSR